MINNFNKKNTKKAFFRCKSTVYQTKKRKREKKRMIKNIDTEGEKKVNRKKDKKRQRKSFTKGEMDGSINEHSTRETSERTLKTEQERIKHNVNLSLKEKRAKQTKVV